MQDDIKGFELSEGWTLETSDHATVFVRYRGVDLVAIWTPLATDSGPNATVSIPSPRQFQEIEDQTRRDRDDSDEIYVEWGAPGAVEINLSEHIEAIDRIRSLIAECADEHRRYPVEDWQYEVANGDTKRGYRDWVNIKAGRH